MLKQLRIGIDCRLAGIEHAGIGRYIEELVRVVTKDQSFQWVLFFHHVHQLPWLQENTHIKIVVVPVRHYTVAEQLQMPFIFARERLDLLHVPHFNMPLLYRGKTIVTIHDLLWHEQKGARVTTLSPVVYALKYQAYKLIVSTAVRRAVSVIVPANTVKDTVMNAYPRTNVAKIQVTYEGIGEKFIDHRAQGIEKSKILFYTGSLYPHKNVMLVVKALEKLPGYKLCISSSRSIFVDEFLSEVKKLGLSERVSYLGRLSDEDLLTWYDKSMALVQPSFSEGFGLTGVEAMAASLPVIASDIAIFKEIYQEACMTFDPYSVDSFVRAVEQIEKSDRQRLVIKGLELIQNYSWEKMGKATLAIYEAA